LQEPVRALRLREPERALSRPGSHHRRLLSWEETGFGIFWMAPPSERPTWSKLPLSAPATCFEIESVSDGGSFVALATGFEIASVSKVKSLAPPQSA